MDHVVVNNGGVKTNLVLGAKSSESSVNDTLIGALDSSQKRKSRTSSNDSVYEIIAELNNEDSENETFSDGETAHENNKGVLNALHGTYEVTQVSDSADSPVMDEEFVILDDDAIDISEDKTVSQKPSDLIQQCSLDSTNISQIAEKVAIEEENVNNSRLSDNEDEIESVYEEDCAETQSEKCDSNAELSLEEDDQMDELLEENVPNEDSSSEQSDKNLNVVLATNNEKLNNLYNFKTDKSSISVGTANDSKGQSLDKQQKYIIQNINPESSISTVDNTLTNENAYVTCDDDKINNMNASSSREILNVEDSSNEVNKDATCIEIEQSKLPRSISFSSSEGDKFEFESMILDIVDESTPEKQNTSFLESNQDAISNSGVSRNLLESLSSIVESSMQKSNIHSANITSTTENKVNSENMINTVTKSKCSVSKENISGLDFSVNVKTLIDNKLNNDGMPSEDISKASVEHQIVPVNTDLSFNLVVKDDIPPESDVNIIHAEIPEIEKAERMKEKVQPDVKINSVIEMPECAKERICSESNIKNDSVEISIIEISNDETQTNTDVNIISAKEKAESANEKKHPESVTKTPSSEQTSENIPESHTKITSSEMFIEGALDNSHPEFDMKMSLSEMCTVGILENAQSECDTKTVSSEMLTLEASENAQSESHTEVVLSEMCAVGTSENTQSNSHTKIISSEMHAVKILENTQSKCDIKIVSSEILTSDNAQLESNMKVSPSEKCSVGTSESTQSGHDEKIIPSEMITVEALDNTSSEYNMKILPSEIPAIVTSEDAQSESYAKIVSSEMLTVEALDNEYSECNMKIPAAETLEGAQSESPMKISPPEIHTVQTPDNAYSECDIKIHPAEVPAAVTVEGAQSESPTKVVSSEILSVEASTNAHSECNVKIPPVGTSEDASSESPTKNAFSEMDTEEMPENTDSECFISDEKTSENSQEENKGKEEKEMKEQRDDEKKEEESISDLEIGSSKVSENDDASDDEIDVVGINSPDSSLEIISSSDDFKSEPAVSHMSEDSSRNVEMEQVKEVKREDLDTSKDITVPEIKAESSGTPNRNLECKVECVKSEASSAERNSSEVHSPVIKRKLEEEEDDDTNIKKAKREVKDEKNSALSGNDSSFALDMKNAFMPHQSIHDQAKDEIKNVFLADPEKKIVTTYKEMNRIASDIYLMIFDEHYRKDFLEAEKLYNELRTRCDIMSKSYKTQIEEANEMTVTQREMFEMHNYKLRKTRTVGVNVKIYRESKIKEMKKDDLKKEPEECLKRMFISTKTEEENDVIPVEEKRRELEINMKKINAVKVEKKDLKETAVPIQNSAEKHTIIAVNAPGKPQFFTHISRPSVGPLSRKIAPPNVTVSGNPLMSIGRPSMTQSVVFVPSSTITSTAGSKQCIDLTKEENKLQINGASGTPMLTTAVAKVAMPGMPNTSNVFLPIKTVQFLPTGSRGTTVIQQTNVPRPTIIPPLPSSLIGTRTVTYIVPPNSGFPGGARIPPFIQPQNQQVRYVLRVTNPGSTPTVTPVINTTPRAPAVPQLPAATAPRSSSGLVLFSHTPKHPAPFPKSPHYPDTKGKAIPPKPSLKGSKNASGIVLSWNMCLFRHHANIASYQLFAYQETDGPVDSSLWKKVGDINALPLPMACTLTQFVDKNRYYFTVRAVDVHQRFGPFSDPVCVLFQKEGDTGSKK